MKRILILTLLLTLMGASANAQRKTDKLDRGLVAVKVGSNTFISWRRLAEEYYDVTYNVYCNDAKIAEKLTVSNYLYSNNSNNTYKVAAVVNGVEQTKSEGVTPWNSVSSVGNAGYVDLTLHSPIYARDGRTNMTDQYIPNDIEMADLDGDGQLDILLKRKSVYDEADYYLKRTSEATKAYDRIEAYKLDVNATNKMKLLWWIDVGPNMVSLNSTELNMLAFDWDQDGAAEVLLRGANGMIIHYLNSNGVETGTQVIGDNPNEDTRDDVSHIANATFTWSGAEYLLYLNGETGQPYPIGYNGKLWMDYPLKRLENGETDVPDAWWYSAQYNGGKTGILGHRDSKYYFGAPYLDGHNPSIFLARGIYTRHKMIAYDVNPQTHQLTQRWRWDCNTRNSPWFGQGYHNYIVADVDEDGCDEIVYGSMVIDDNGKGLYTTGYGHGDAQHVRDFDPYRKGMEMFACLEEYPYWGSNYRNAGTGEIYYKYTSPVEDWDGNTNHKFITVDGRRIMDNDDGRCLAGNFFNDIPGSQGRSVGSGLVGLSRNVNGKAEELFSHNEAEPWVDYSWLNFRLYWDGDLVDEILDSPAGSTADNHAGAVIKFDRTSTNGKGTRLFNADGSLLNNGTKNNACFLGDILGDWREEFILRTSPTTMRLYTTVVPTDYPIYTLWHDHQYRQAMGTQMQVYNLPPNPSFFLGEMEGITVAPPPLTTEGRTVIGNNTNINHNYDGQHLLHSMYANTELNVSGGTPAILTINVPTRVQGNDNNNITTTTYTCSLTGGALSGSTRLIKQGNGILTMNSAIHTNTGETNIWGGTVNMSCVLTNSPIWMNRHTTLNILNNYQEMFGGGITMEYGSTLNVGIVDGYQDQKIRTVNVSTLTMNYGSRVVLDVNGAGEAEHDWLNAATLNVDVSKVGIDAWENYGPEYIVPVFELNMSSTLGEGRYPIGHVTNINGDLSLVKLECDAIPTDKLRLVHEDGILYLQVSNVAIANKATIEISGMANYGSIATPYPSTSPNDYYLPIVSIVGNNTNGQAPTLSGTFTAFDGTVTALNPNSNSFTFPKPGILEVTSSLDGFVPSTKTFEVKYPYYLFYGRDFDEIEVDQAATILGSDYWNSSRDESVKRIAYWSKTCTKNNSKYYGQANYYIVKNKINGSGVRTYVDNRQILWVDYVDSGTPLLLIESFGLTKNLTGGYSFYAENLGDENTVIYHKYDMTRGDTETEANIEEGYVFAEADGTYTHALTSNYSLAKFHVYVPVSIHDEMATSLPRAVSTTGNAHLWRNGMQNTSTWATLVVPFDMTAKQVREVFGDGTTVACLETNKGNNSQIYFVTTNVSDENVAVNEVIIHKNEPCLVKGVTKNPPYLIMGITSNPITDGYPQVGNGIFSFIGTYIDQSPRTFELTDYFFTSSGLSRVENTDVQMNFKGYRGYFHTNQTNGAKSIEVVFDEPNPGVATDIKPAVFIGRDEDVYDLQGRNVPRSQWQNGTLRKGVYIVGGRKIIVK